MASLLLIIGPLTRMYPEVRLALASSLAEMSALTLGEHRVVIDKGVFGINIHHVPRLKETKEMCLIQVLGSRDKEDYKQDP